MTERDAQIIDLYLNHPELSNKEIAKMFNISDATISRIARINNLPRRLGNSGKRFSIEQEKEIVNKYLKPTPLLSLQKEYGISYDRIKAIIKKYSDVKISSAKRLNHNLNEDFFKVIDSKEKAYWLGWTISDGTILNQPEKSKYQLELTIKTEDEEILHQFEKDLGVINRVYTFQKKYKKFSLGSKTIVNDLNNLGITQNKTFTVKVPNFPSEYNSSFIRGLFDGDGGFTSYTRTTGQKCCELSFCGNEFIIEWIRKTLLQEIPELTPNSITKENSIKRIRWSSKKDILLLKEYLYNKCDNHYLERKFKLIQANTEVNDQIAKGQSSPQSVDGE